MTITVQLTPELAQGLREGVGTESAADLERIANELNVTFRPLHPHTNDPVLSSYLVADVSDPEVEERLLSRLRRSPAVKAAYVKPPDAMA
jgi:transcriptional regulator with XRE-family HTH domain